jgi:YhcH/YjgK/YiaL family protein
MALFGPFPVVAAQLAPDLRFQAAFEYARAALAPGAAARVRLAGLGAGESVKIELAGGAFAIEQVYAARARPEGFFESHRKYIDVQLVVEGEELMEVEDISRLVVSEAFNAERDLIKYGDTAVASVLRMRAGDAAVFFPEDGHMPSLQWRGPGLVRKSVVKVPVG